jgi:hypothetical protein
MEFFTLDQAQAMLAQVSAEVLAMRACKRELNDLRADLAHVAEASTGNGHVKDETAIAGKRRRAEALADELNRRLGTVNGWGIELKGIEEGLVDFPSERDGRVVYLCWRLGEDRIAWWHEIDTGFAGRQSL